MPPYIQSLNTANFLFSSGLYIKHKEQKIQFFLKEVETGSLIKECIKQDQVMGKKLSGCLANGTTAEAGRYVAHRQRSSPRNTLPCSPFKYQHISRVNNFFCAYKKDDIVRY